MSQNIDYTPILDANSHNAILCVLQKESKGYQYNPFVDKTITVVDEFFNKIARISMNNFILHANSNFSVDENKRDVFTQKEAKSSDKTDIRIVLHDKRTRLNSEMGFSIKSQIGGNSTLLNASEATNFTFKIVGVNLTNEEIESINRINPSRNKVIERYKAILRKGGRFQYSHIDNDVFERNIQMLDGDMAHLVASMLIVQLDEGISAFPQLIETMSETNPLRFKGNNLLEIYTYKAKHLLTAAALGMMPATLWTGRFDANGGYLVVKNDGDIVCYHFYDRNRFEDYLFTNAYLERASTTRHKYAMVYKDLNGDLMFKLNLQIRLR